MSTMHKGGGARGGGGGAKGEEAVTAAEATLDRLKKDGHLNDESHNIFLQKFRQLHTQLIQQFEVERQLSSKANLLTKQLMNEALNLEKAQQQQKKNEETLRELENTIGEVNKDIETIQERRAALKAEIHLLENDKGDLENEIKNKEAKAKERIIPEINRVKAMIDEINGEMAATQIKIEKEEQQNSEIEMKILAMEKDKEEYRDKIELLQQDFMKDRDEPVRLGKGNENLRKAVEHLRADLEKLLQETKVHEEEAEKQNKITAGLAKQVGELDAQLLEEDKAIKELNKDTRNMMQITSQHQEEQMRINNEQALIAQNLEENRRTIKYHEDLIKQLSKQLSEKLRAKVKVEAECKELENQQAVTEKEHTVVANLLKEKKKEMEGLAGHKGALDDEQKIFVGQLVKKGLEEKNMQAKIMKLKSDIVQHEKQVQQFQEEENKWIEEIKFLSTIREKMARTASQAMAQARETKEELKVKELLILDLTKKQQETEFRLNSFIALYEEVKNARNKYVSQIQNSSQDLAEMKERIKILQNEVEILRNESSEKDRALIDIRHHVQKEIYKRDSLRAELNKKDFVYKQKKSIIGQKINEGDKLNLIINSLQKEMNDLIYKYEMACESRNYMGIQLIDRNDELCIYYEKCNIQENRLKEGEQTIRQKEEEIRMINLEHKERQRQLEVVRKQIPEVPKLAQQVHTLKSQLDRERDKVNELSKMLENPDKHPHWRDLGGEDPDQEALQAKIQVLEERLNNKKENLLEKELVYEEVSNLAEKLRAQALDGRKSTLEIAEKINEYKARTTDLSRKMLATVSELSMFQSKALKMQQEKEEKERIIDEAMARLNQGMPPTDTAESEWEKIERKRLREEQNRDERIQRKILEQQLPTIGTKTHALPRPNSYMPADIQIPRPYGSFAPFMPSEPGSSMRHIIKPKIREIEY